MVNCWQQSVTLMLPLSNLAGDARGAVGERQAQRAFKGAGTTWQAGESPPAAFPANEVHAMWLIKGQLWWGGTTSYHAWVGACVHMHFVK